MRKRKALVVSAAAVIAIYLASAQATTMQVHSDATLMVAVANVSSAGGLVRVALYDEANYSGHDQRPVAAAAVEARSPETVATFRNIPPGTYAVKSFQDIPRSGTFQTSALGLPEEPFGFSNDARPTFDQPSFNATKFTLASGPNRIVVHLYHPPF